MHPPSDCDTSGLSRRTLLKGSAVLLPSFSLVSIAVAKPASMTVDMALSRMSGQEMSDLVSGGLELPGGYGRVRSNTLNPFSNGASDGLIICTAVELT